MQSEVLRNSRINIALEAMVSKKQISPSAADCLKRNYVQFCQKPEVEKAAKSFDKRVQKLDNFIFNLASECRMDNKDLRVFFQKIVVMFHGNAAVERRFSVNREYLVENLSEDSIIPQRCVDHAVSAVGEVKDDVISKAVRTNITVR